MPRTKKTETATATPIVADAPEQVVAPEVVPTENQVVEASTVVETVEEVSLGDAFTDVLTQINGLRTQITALSSQIRAIRARSERELRLAQKVTKRRKNPNRKPSGFVKPALISPELATFLNKPKGSEMARTDVTREINAYIKEHNLQNPENRRFINPDAKLRKLLKLGKTDELSYFNLQKYISPHFTKVEATA